MSAFCLVLGNNFTRIPRHEAEVISKKTNGRINQDKSIDDQNLKEASFGQFCSKRNSCRTILLARSVHNFADLIMPSNEISSSVILLSSPSDGLNYMFKSSCSIVLSQK